MSEESKIYNYCHDPEIAEAAERFFGITDPDILNEAFSRGEQHYDGFERAIEYLAEQAKKGED